MRFFYASSYYMHLLDGWCTIASRVSIPSLNNLQRALKQVLKELERQGRNL